MDKVLPKWEMALLLYATTMTFAFMVDTRVGYKGHSFFWLCLYSSSVAIFRAFLTLALAFITRKILHFLGVVDEKEKLTYVLKFPVIHVFCMYITKVVTYPSMSLEDSVLFGIFSVASLLLGIIILSYVYYAVSSILSSETKYENIRRLGSFEAPSEAVLCRNPLLNNNVQPETSALQCQIEPSQTQSTDPDSGVTQRPTEVTQRPESEIPPTIMKQLCHHSSDKSNESTDREPETIDKRNPVVAPSTLRTFAETWTSQISVNSRPRTLPVNKTRRETVNKKITRDDILETSEPFASGQQDSTREKSKEINQKPVTPDGRAWETLECKTRHGTVYKTVLWNRKLNTAAPLQNLGKK